MDSINWIHISDLHFKIDSKWDQNIIFDALKKDIIKQRNNFGPYNLLFITGDLTYSAKSEEYDYVIEKINELIEVADVSKTNVMIVPGNHDVNRNQIIKKIHDERDEIETLHEINEIIEDKERYNEYFKRFDNYNSFLNKFYGGNHPNLKNSFYNWLNKKFYNERLGVIGINSAWSSFGGRGDLGNIFLSEIQVKEALEKIQDCDIKIAIMHHPIDWIHPGEKLTIRTDLHSNCNFILHGHDHDPNINETNTLDGYFITIPAGAVYLGRRTYWTNGYNIVQYPISGSGGRITFRRYSERKKEFVRDVDLTGDDKNGIHELNIVKVLDSISKEDEEEKHDAKPELKSKGSIHQIPFPTTKPMKIAVEYHSEHELITDIKDFPDGILSFKARIDYPSEAGSAGILKISVNGIIIEESYSLNQKGTFRIKDGRVRRTYFERKQSWRIRYSPSFLSNTLDPIYQVLDKDPYLFIFNISDCLIKGQNRILFAHTGNDSQQAFHKSIIIEDFQLYPIEYAKGKKIVYS